MSRILDHYVRRAQSQNWRDDTATTTSLINGKLHAIATDRGSLTQALQAIDKDSFEVRVLKEEVCTPYDHEQIKLSRPLSQSALVREVELCLFKSAVVYARSIIPLELLRSDANGLAGLGKTPLGQVLFTDGRIRVSKRQFLLDTNEVGQEVARRTPYEYQGHTILVSEFFLPALESLL